MPYSYTPTIPKLVTALQRRLVQWLVRPRILPERDPEQLYDFERHTKPLCFILPTDAAADHIVLEHICRTHQLNPLQGQTFVASSAAAAYIFHLDHWRGFLKKRLDKRPSVALQHFVQVNHALATHDCALIPVQLFWGRAPERESSWLRLPFAELWAQGGWLRRALTVLINGRNLVVQFGNPIPIRSILYETSDTGIATRRVARTCRNALHRQRVATLGPETAQRQTLITQVLRTQAVRQAIRNEIKSKHLTTRQAITLAKQHAEEIAANYSHLTVNVLSRLMQRLWTRVYDGIELHHIDKLRTVIEDNAIVYVPCHRSHMDYLLLSHIIYHHGFAVPHIAAGVNLNLPIIGRILRKCGAFFIRRSFAGSPLYTVVFNKYLGLLLARGHAIEYFIEGGRSRTGRLLQPKTGALSMTVRNYLRDPKRPIIFVPVYFGYERLIEGQTYIGELSGQSKQKESVRGLLRTLPLLRHRFGKVHVSIGDPITLTDLLSTHAPASSSVPIELGDKPLWLNHAIDDLAIRIMRNINSAACVTPINLLALCLLATPKQSLSESDLIRQLELYISLLHKTPYSAATVITNLHGAAMIQYGEALRIIQRRHHPLGDMLWMDEHHAILMTYCRNNVLHLLVMPSILASCFLNNSALSIGDIQRLVWRIYPFLAQELFLPWQEQDIAPLVLTHLHNLAAHGLLETHDDGTTWLRPAISSIEAVQLSMLAQLTIPTLQRYYLTIALLLQTGSGKMSQATLEQQCHLVAQRMSFLYELNAPEFFDKSLFENFIDLLRARKVLGTDAEGRLTFTELLLAAGDDAELVLHEQIRNSVLQIMHR